jgi:UDP-N-acetylglucosamine 2-epimerase (non-hydrolysing)
MYTSKNCESSILQRLPRGLLFVKKVLLVFGTRPEAIKMAPLCSAFKREHDFETIVCVTAQHREMLDQVLSLFELAPDIDLNIMKPGQDLYDVTNRVLIGMRDVLASEKPDVVLVHGDTTTTFAASVAAFYAGIPVGHVEAGLRTYDLTAPFPEEFNRRTAGLVATFHFCPTVRSQFNLLNEGKSDREVFVTGNTIIDALHWVLDKIEDDNQIRESLEGMLEKLLGFDFQREQFVLITGHRRENFGAGFLNICEAIKTTALKYPNVRFVYPVHLNPNVLQPVRKVLSGLNNIHLIEPLEYLPFVYLLKHCYLVLTDSGGIQEEAPSLGKPVLVMRDVTERPEAVNAGTVKLVGSSSDTIAESIQRLLNDQDLYGRMSSAHNPYGDGKACSRIVAILREALESH